MTLVTCVLNDNQCSSAADTFRVPLPSLLDLMSLFKMETVHSLTTARCETAVSAVAAELLARSSHIVLERLPLKQESRDLESSLEQNKQDVPEEEGR